MAYSSEIEKLRARYNENPKGRNFAPLADAYRKAKQLDEAILLCREGLQLHPDYVSAHIVLGRCLVDRREDAAAGETFRRVLELDPENIIALKMLADIAMRAEHPLEAVEWLTRLLQVDPMNGEAADALALARGKAAMTPATEPEIEVESDAELQVDTVELASTLPEIAGAPTEPMAAAAREAPAPVPPARRSTVSEAPIESYDGRIDFSSVEQAAAEIEGLTSEEPETVAAEEIAPADGLARSHYEGSGMFKVDLEAESAAPDSDAETTDLPLIMPDELELSAPPVAFAGEERTAEPAPVDELAVLPPPVRPRGFPDDDGAAEQAALSSAEPVLTETMAELYLQQGHVEDALRVYQRLLEGDPGNGELQARIDALTGARRPRRSGPTATEFLRNVLRGDRVAPPVVVEADAAATGAAPDTVMDEVFDDLVPEAPLPHAGAPTQPAAHPLSLERVFGEPRDAAADATLAGAAAVGAPTGFSFDDFFAAAESLPHEGGGAPATAAGGSTAESSAQPSEAEQDLDQFQAWLRSLKS